MTFNLEKSSTKLLVLLLFTDLIFVFLHVFYNIHLLRDPLFSMTKDGGYAEMYQYIKEYWIVLLLGIMAIKNSKMIYFTWSALFAYLLIDDSLRVHEQFGNFVVEYFGFQPAFGLRAQDFAELSVSMFFGALLFLSIGGAYYLSDNKAKEISKHLVILIGVLVFFGVFVDMLHSMIPWGRRIFAMIEDGGEMLAMSLIVWYVFGLDLIQREPELQENHQTES
ncbi:MAG: hypothetical protein ABFS02_09660 [Pseudomonadota bacterium]